MVAGTKAMYKGVGLVRGADGFGFMLSAVDAAFTPRTTIDLFRIKIWEPSSGTIVSDNMLGSPENADLTTTIGGGSIVIHK